MQANPRAIADIIPVDLLVNAMISVTWSAALCKPDSVKIYHVTSGDLNPLTWGYMGTYQLQMFARFLVTILYANIFMLPWWPMAWFWHSSVWLRRECFVFADR